MLLFTHSSLPKLTFFTRVYIHILWYYYAKQEHFLHLLWLEVPEEAFSVFLSLDRIP